MTAFGTAQGQAADDQMFAAWLNAPPPAERDAEAEGFASRYFAYFGGDPSGSVLRKILIGDNMIEIGRVVVTTNSTAYQAQRARAAGREAVLTFETIAGIAPGVGRTLVVEWRRLPNLHKLAAAGRLNRRVLIWKLEQMGRSLRDGRNAGRLGESFAALKIARSIFMPALVTGECPEGPPIAGQAAAFDGADDWEDGEREGCENSDQRPPAWEGAACAVARVNRTFDDIKSSILNLGQDGARVPQKS